ncbi:histidine phosphatase family protein [Nocardia brasiliensis]|uniref:histidine phosphatase family protein n=1 Tax=Nocardia brasiliensis TaxID=37326 RepID=UPI002455A03C|nr:histidine phosphatase family protein [Nocardia brasiliensis]
MSPHNGELHEVPRDPLTNAPASTPLILVRHASSVRAKIGIWGRRFDAPLAVGFEHQLTESRSKLGSLHNPIIFSSPMKRCIQTANYLFPNRFIHVVDGLKAYHSGILEDVTEEYLREHHPNYMSSSFRDRFLRPSYGEESMADQAIRVAGGLLLVLKEQRTLGNCTDVGASVIFAHYSTINIIAHIVSRNFSTDTYADGVYDLQEGAFIRFEMDPATAASDIREHFRLAS